MLVIAEVSQKNNYVLTGTWIWISKTATMQNRL